MKKKFVLLALAVFSLLKSPASAQELIQQEMTLEKFSPQAPLGPNEERCGDYLIFIRRGHSDGQESGPAINYQAWIEMQGERVLVQGLFLRSKFETTLDGKKEKPSVMVRRERGLTKVELKMNGPDYKRASCLPQPKK